MQEKEKTWFSVGCDLSSVLVLQLNSSSKILKMWCPWVCMWSYLYMWVCLCIWKGSNETKPKSHCRILLITNLVWDISLRVGIRGPTSGNLCACLARNFCCFFFVSKLLLISIAHATIWQCTNICISAELEDSVFCNGSIDNS